MMSTYTEAERLTALAVGLRLSPGNRRLEELLHPDHPDFDDRYIPLFLGMATDEDWQALGRTSAPRVERSARELVVAAYAEDLSWLSQVPFPVTIYTKGSAYAEGFPVYRLPNVGREAHTFLWHIVQRWDSLSELTLFVQGGPFDHSPDLLRRVELDYVEPLPLATRYLEHVPAAEVKATDRVEHHQGFEFRWGMGDYFGQFSGDGTAARGRTGDWCRRVWAEVFDCPMPSPLWFGYGAMWAVPKAFIRRRPVEFWRWLLQRLSGPEGRSKTDRNDEHPLTAWGMELLWGWLFEDPALHPHHCPPAAEPSLLEAHLAKVAKVKACPHWSKEGCGCSAGKCSNGKGQLGTGLVSFQECFECLGI